jgi:hypothetical protein
MAPARVSTSDSDASSSGDVSMADAHAGATRDNDQNHDIYTPVSSHLSLGRGLVRAISPCPFIHVAIRQHQHC